MSCPCPDCKGCTCVSLCINSEDGICKCPLCTTCNEMISKERFDYGFTTCDELLVVE